jgi:hypothetical protein
VTDEFVELFGRTWHYPQCFLCAGSGLPLPEDEGGGWGAEARSSNSNLNLNHDAA